MDPNDVAAKATETATPTEATPASTAAQTAAAPLEPASTEAPPLAEDNTSAPALPDTTQVPESEERSTAPVGDTAPVSAEPVTADDEEDEDQDEVPLPGTLGEAHAEILRLRKWRQKKNREYRKLRDSKRTAETEAGGLRSEYEKATSKLESLRGESASTTAQLEAARKSVEEIEARHERYRQHWISKFPEGPQRVIAEKTELDLLPTLFEQFNAAAKAPEPVATQKQEAPPSATRQTVVRNGVTPPKPTTFNGYFIPKNGRTGGKPGAGGQRRTGGLQK